MPITRPQKRAISPSEESQPRGTEIIPGIRTTPPPAPLPHRTNCPPLRVGPSHSAPASAGGGFRPQAWESLDLRDLGMGGQQRLREHVVEGKDPEEGDDDRLVDGSAHSLG